ncbi:MAG: inorganic diphosphatase [bacterium]|nr:inorganic diphosphatase [bacterium]
MDNHYSLFHRIKQENAPEELMVLVEIPEGCANKYEFDKDLGALVLDRVLYGPNVYPVNYCDVPGTWNEGDNDPLDVMLFSSFPVHPGTLAKGRVIGIMEMDDNGEVDHKVLCVAKKDPRFDHVKTVDDLTEYQKKDIKTFFETYKIPQTGRDTVKVGEFKGPEAAHAFIEECLKAYDAKFGA